MMQSLLLFTFLSAATASNSQIETNPIEKVIEMMSDLQQKIIKEGEAAQKIYDDFAEWCEEESKNLQFEIKTGKATAEELTATIDQAVSDIKAGEDKIGELGAKIAQDEADLKAATEIRDKEHADFLAEEADLVDTVDALERAIGILEREMAKTGGAAFMQLKNARNVAAALQVLVQAAAISSSDASKLTALVQTQQQNEDGDAEFGAPDPAAYKGQSGGIIDVLNDLLADAEGQLADARKKESNLQHNYDMLKQELEDAVAFANKEKDKAAKANAASAEAKATAEGDLEVTNKDLAQDIKQLAATHHECMTKAQDFEAETASRGEELKALAQAKKIIIEATGGATAQTYSFLQMASASRLSTRADLANFEAVKYVQKLSEKLGSAALAQLANRMNAAARMGAAAGEDPFAKVKGLISEMIERLLKEAEADAAHKGYCDKEMSETKAKKEELTDEIEALTTKIDKMSADSAKLKEEVATLSKELADLAKSQAEMDKVREEESTAFVANKKEMEEGLEGIKLALKVLRDYYAKEDKAHQAAEGAGGGIIGMLEVIESDFSKGLAEMISVEETAAAEYEQQTKDNEIAKTTKEQDVKYKTKEAKSLDKAVAEHTSDREGLQTELDAVLDYWEKIKEQCIAKAEPYEERKKRREAEIAGLKEALAILEGEAALLQKNVRRHRSFRHGHSA
jgi:hypothetical protein